MAPKFRVSTHRNSDNLHLKLIGDFDGTSALQVLEVLKEDFHGISRIFIHTSSLDSIHSSGRIIFNNNFDVTKGTPVPILFTGEKAQQLAPQGNRIC